MTIAKLRKHALLLLLVLCWVVAAAPGQQTSAVAVAGPHTIALTFDDIPMAVVGNDHIAGPLGETQYINANILRILGSHQAPAIGFVNEAKLNVEGERDARAQILEDWLKAGMLLGNHTYSHVEFNTVSLPAFEEELVRGDVITAPVMKAHGLQEHWFRHPYLDTGGSAEKKSGFESFAAAHGYRIAPVTIQNEDWMFNASYDQARQQHDAAQTARVKAAYLAHTADAFAHVEQLSKSAFGRQIPLVILMHADILNAENLDAVLMLMEQRGYRFVTLDQAMADPAYATPDQYTGASGSSWLDRWQLALGHPMKPSDPEPPQWIQQNYDRLTETPKP